MNLRRGGALLLAAALLLTVAAASAPRKSSPDAAAVDVGRWSPSAVFPVHGSVYPHGLYYVSMMIGDPPKPYFLDVDTGSDLTWLQCDAPCVSCHKGPHSLYRPVKKKLVSCNDPLCASLRSSPLKSIPQNCDSHQQCDYEIQYHDDGSSLGVLVTDAFSLRLVNNSIARPHLAFGCGYDQRVSRPNEPSPTDGVLGLGSGKSSILSQMHDQGITRSVVGHCLGRRGGGFLFFGDGLVPSHGMTWVPMTRSGIRNYYSPGPARLFLGKQSLGLKELQVIFDSGSSYTYFANQPYQTFLSAVKKDLLKSPLKEASDDPSLPICWKGPKLFKSVLEVKKYFSPLILGFANGRRFSGLEIPPENYLIVTNHGSACLGILNGTEVGLKDLNVIGDISMQDLMVVYDNEEQKIGWARMSCDKTPNEEEDAYRIDEGLCETQVKSMGVFTEECPAYYNNHKAG